MHVAANVMVKIPTTACDTAENEACHGDSGPNQYDVPSRDNRVHHAGEDEIHSTGMGVSNI